MCLVIFISLTYYADQSMILYVSKAMVSQLRHLTFFLVKKQAIFLNDVLLLIANDWRKSGRTRKSFVPLQVHIKLSWSSLKLVRVFPLHQP